MRFLVKIFYLKYLTKILDCQVCVAFLKGVLIIRGDILKKKDELMRSDLVWDLCGFQSFPEVFFG